MLKCSHILCKVPHIGECVAQLAQAGFCVQRGGGHNALVWFEEGPFLEFFELPGWCRLMSLPFGLRYGRSTGRRLAHWARAGSGWCDVALEPRVERAEDPLDLSDVAGFLRQHAAGTSRVVSGRRAAEAGGDVRYRFMTPGDPALPFIVSHYHPRQRPVRVRHANGATAVARVNFQLPSAARAALTRLLPQDAWLRASVGDARRVESVILRGWQPLPDTAPFIRSLFCDPSRSSDEQ